MRLTSLAGMILLSAATYLPNSTGGQSAADILGAAARSVGELSYAVRHFDLDFADLDKAGAVVAPFRWRFRRPPLDDITVLVLVDGDLFDELSPEKEPAGTHLMDGPASLRALPVGRYEVVLRLANSSSGHWLGVDSPRRVLVVDADDTSPGDSGQRMQESCKLPTANALDSHCVPMTRADDDNECVRALQQDLYSAQHVHCRRQVSGTVPPWGFANSLHMMVLQLQRARRLGLTISWSGTFLYSACESRDFSCAFCDGPSCPFKAVASCASDRVPESFDSAVKGTFEDAWKPDAAFRQCFRGPHALLRYVSTLTGYLFRPSDAVLARVQALRADLALPTKYLGVHIRHGDACMGGEAEDTRGCYGIPAFAEALHSLGELYEVSHVYVASDNPQAMPLLQQLLPNMGVYHNTQGERDFLSAGVFGEQDLNATMWSMVEHKLADASSGARQSQMEGILVDALILSSCHAFVGQLSSHMSRLFLELAINEQMRVVPHISIDSSSWCWGNWGPVKC
jgi:hypothetical protein